MLKWFGHVERMDEYCMSRWVSIVEVGGARGKPRLGWMDSVKIALSSRGMMVEYA